MTVEHPRAFLLSVGTEYGIRRIRAIPGFDTRDGFVTPLFSPYDEDTHLTDFEVTAYLDHEHNEAWGAAHQFTPHIVDLRRAEVMLRVLRKVERGMDKAYQQFGHPATFHAYLLQVAYALRIKRFLVRRADGQPHPDSVRYTTHTAPSIAYWIADQGNTHSRTATV